MATTQVHKKPSKSTIAKMRRLVFPRDSWTCQDCGYVASPRSEDELTGRYAPSAPGGWLELDHVIPRARGGLFIASNLRPLCSSCNRRKCASTRFVGWPDRITLAVELLQAEEPTERTAVRAVRILTGGEA